MFRWSDSRRPQLRYENHIRNTPELITKKCDACGFLTADFIPLYPTGVLVIPGTGTEIPPIVCRNFQTCCMRYRRGLSPAVFAAQVNWMAYV
jgi:hypothetical protein